MFTNSDTEMLVAKYHILYSYPCGQNTDQKIQAIPILAAVAEQGQQFHLEFSWNIFCGVKPMLLYFLVIL